MLELKAKVKERAGFRGEDSADFNVQGRDSIFITFACRIWTLDFCNNFNLPSTEVSIRSQSGVILECAALLVAPTTHHHSFLERIGMALFY